jgi:hypothetical protein
MEQCLYGFCAEMDENALVNAVEKNKDELTKEISEKANGRAAAANDDGSESGHAGLLNACAVLLIIFGMYKTIIGFRQLPSNFYLLGIVNILGTLLIWYGVYGLLVREKWSIGFVLCISLAGAVVLAAELAFGWLVFGLHLLFISLLIISLLILTGLSRKYCS